MVSISIFIHKSKRFINITLQNKCKEQDIAICPVKIKFLERELGRQLQTGRSEGIEVWQKSSKSAVK
jgi:hypothetical protein